MFGNDAAHGFLGRGGQPTDGATGGNVTIAARSAPIRSDGAHPSDRLRRWLACPVIHDETRTLKSSGLVNVRPGRNERSMSLASVMGPPCCHEYGTTWRCQ